MGASPAANGNTLDSLPCPFLAGIQPLPAAAQFPPDHVRKNGSGPSGGREVLSALEGTSQGSGPKALEEKVQFNTRRLGTHVRRWPVDFGSTLLNRTSSSEREGAI